MARIALDAMGGDFAPQATVAGALLALAELDPEHTHPARRAAPPSCETQLRALLDGRARGARARIAIASTIVEAPDVIEMSDKPAAALRGKPNSSMVVGLRLQAEGKSDAFVSAGNTGAQMAASTVVLKLHAGLTRPAIATLFPDRARSRSSSLDSGANVDCAAEELVQFARLGAVVRRGRARPRQSRRRPAQHRRRAGEGQRGREGGAPAPRGVRAQLPAATSRGATSRRAAATAARSTSSSATASSATWCSSSTRPIAPMMIGMLQKTPASIAEQLEAALKHLDYSEYGGAPLLGVNGVSIISHGKSSPRAHQERDQGRRAAPSRRGMNEHIGARLGEHALRESTREAPVRVPRRHGPVRARSKSSRTTTSRRSASRRSHEWIVERTGIRERHIAGARRERPARMAADARAHGDGARRRACRRARRRSCSAPRRPTACCRRRRSTCRRSSAPRARPRSTSRPRARAGCTACIVAEGLMRAGIAETALVVGAEKMSAIVDWKDRSTCVLFGDGAGAAVLKRSQAAARESSRTFIRSDGTLAELLYRPAGGAARAVQPRPCSDDRSSFVKMAGREVFKHAVRSMSEACDRALDGAQADRRRHRPADPAPGEHPHHRGDGEAREHPDGQGLRERRPLRQHVVGVDPDRARRGDRARARQRKARPCCSSPSAPASPGPRWSFASSAHAERRSAVSRAGLAEAGDGEGPRRRASPPRATSSRPADAALGEPLSHALLRGPGRDADAHAQRAAGAARARRGRRGPSCATRSATRCAPRPATRSASSRRITPPARFALADAVRLVRRRGELMYEAGVARPGAMAAILGDADRADRGDLRRRATRRSAASSCRRTTTRPGQVVISRRGRRAWSARWSSRRRRAPSARSGSTSAARSTRRSWQSRVAGLGAGARAMRALRRSALPGLRERERANR